MSLSLGQAQWLIGFMRHIPGQGPAPMDQETLDEEYARAMYAQQMQASQGQNVQIPESQYGMHPDDSGQYGDGGQYVGGYEGEEYGGS